MERKPKTGRCQAIEMLEKMRKCRNMGADPKWVDGMVIAWVKMLIRSCTIKRDITLNFDEISDEVRNMIGARLLCGDDHEGLQPLVNTCVKWGILYPFSADHYEVKNG